MPLSISARLSSVCKDEAFCKAYREWTESPVTQRVVSLAKEAALCSPLSEIRAEVALYYSGRVDAISDFEKALLSLVALVQETQKRNSELASLRPTYGVEPPKQDKESKK